MFCFVMEYQWWSIGWMEITKNEDRDCFSHGEKKKFYSNWRQWNGWYSKRIVLVCRWIRMDCCCKTSSITELRVEQWCERIFVWRSWSLQWGSEGENVVEVGACLDERSIWSHEDEEDRINRSSDENNVGWDDNEENEGDNDVSKDPTKTKPSS